MLKGKTALVTGSTQGLGLISIFGLRAVILETAAQNITCNAICPDSSPTPAIEQRLADFMAKEKLPREEAVKAFMGSRQSSGRFVSPSESRAWSPSCAGQTALTPQGLPFQSTAVGAQRSLSSNERGGEI